MTRRRWGEATDAPAREDAHPTNWACCDSQSRAPTKWTGMRVARPLLRFGLPSEALGRTTKSPPSHKAMEDILRTNLQGE